MDAGTVNLIVFVGIVLIVSSVLAVFVLAATRRGGRKVAHRGKPSKAMHRKVNPKTGDLFP
jgi:hypothetical protein